MFKKNGKIWILTADQAKAKIFEWIPEHKGLTEIFAMSNDDARKPEHDLKSDRSGHGHGQGPNAKSRYSVEERTSYKQHASHAFLKELAEHLSKENIISTYDTIVMIAQDDVYKTIQNNLSPACQGKVSKHHAKNLTNMPTPDLVEYYIKHLT
ncbi:MAG: host attachment protein [Sphingomonadales bacterium]|nr:host attachment protein [Sphingomonadales bacterium]